ncbi:DUF4864 domain-containing protein [Defluviimonas sp. D31]|uniref:DUF4864 domain-containing protein n=1 Tax=Defluviimonas sp. D31 TaxID=3083253 RepID=UPI00296E991D|nr:DUF4864 domain-containing protein [Defluviimonas sp. D31]MDW4551134.1 DUF4864 domain-containing protein [Defluviimonas sp. D31]
MRFRPCVPALALMLLAPVLPARGEDGAEIRGVIGAQIEAFAADDLAAAFGFASPMIRHMFQTPETFGNMVRQGYPMIWRPGAVRYLGLREEDGRMLQRMGFVDGEGRLHLFDYDMVQSRDGWRINGVHPVSAPAAGV